MGVAAGGKFRPAVWQAAAPIDMRPGDPFRLDPHRVELGGEPRPSARRFEGGSGEGGAGDDEGGGKNGGSHVGLPKCRLCGRRCAPSAGDETLRAAGDDALAAAYQAGKNKCVASDWNAALRSS